MFNSLQETLKSATASGLHETRENWKESLLPASSRQVPLSFQQPLGGDGRRIISAAQAASVPSGSTKPRYRFSVLRTREGSCHQHDLHA